jgi:hypothetical protein
MHMADCLKCILHYFYVFPVDVELLPMFCPCSTCNYSSLRKAVGVFTKLEHTHMRTFISLEIYLGGFSLHSHLSLLFARVYSRTVCRTRGSRYI